MGISLLSLAGIPPTAGFFGKLFLLTSAVSGQMYILLGIAAVNLVLSLYNYLRVIKYMFVDEATEDVPEVKSNVYEIIVYTFCMRNKLEQAEKDALERRSEEDQRVYVTQGIAKLGEVLHINYENIDEMGYAIIHFLVNYLKANQAIFFQADYTNPEDPCVPLQYSSRVQFE